MSQPLPDLGPSPLNTRPASARQAFCGIGVVALMLIGACVGGEVEPMADAGLTIDAHFGLDAPGSDGATGDEDGGGIGAGGLDAGGLDASGRGDAYIPPAIDGGPRFPTDGWCGEGDWAVCIDFDGYGDDASGRRKLTVADQEALEFHYWGLEHGPSDSVDNAPVCATRSTMEGEKGDCDPLVENGQVRLSAESTGFGLAQMRFDRPVVFRSDEGEPETRHLHFDSSMVTHGRLFAAIHFSEMPSAGMPDLRLIRDVSTPSDPGRSVSIVFSGDDRRGIKVIHWNPPTDGQRCTPDSPVDECYDSVRIWSGDADFDVDPTNPELRDRMFGVDVYLSRTHVRVVVDGREYADTDIADIGFDAGYLSLMHAAYNPMKLAGGAGRDWPGEMTSILFDNIAFDGPTTARNALIPEGFEQVIFFTLGAAECTIAGSFPSVVAPTHKVRWNPVYTLVPEDYREIELADIVCDQPGRYEGNFLDLHRIAPRP